MSETRLRVLRAQEIAQVLNGQEAAIMAAVRAAYETHARGASALPQSTFLRFPDDAQNRIIALPAYLGETFGVAGMKWIASFPGNIKQGIARASAVIVLNAAETGRPTAIVEGSIISAKRTAASAALAAQYVHQEEGVERIGLIGCGVINEEIARFLRAVYPTVVEWVVYDVERERAKAFGERVAGEGMRVEVVKTVGEVLERVRLASFATTAGRPHVESMDGWRNGSTILHISLRDLAPAVVLSCENIVDDREHVCRAETSLHLTEQQVGHREFIRCTLADITLGKAAARRDAEGIAVYSPFGLGVLDLAVSKLALALADEAQGLWIDDFLPV